VSEARKVADAAAKVAATAEKVAEAAAEESEESAEVAPAAAAAGDGEVAPAPVRSTRATRSTKVEPYNDALPFIEFVAAHPVGSEVEARVDRFSSHGAYVSVGPVRAYLPLRNMADPAPRSAKELLELDQEIRVVVAAIHPPLRGIDVALPGVVTAAPPEPAELVAELAEATAGVEADAGPELAGAAARAIAADAEPPGGAAARGKPRGGARKRTSAAERTPEQIAAARSEAAKKAAATRAAKRAAAAAAADEPATTGTEASPTTEKAPAKKASAKKSPAK